MKYFRALWTCLRIDPDSRFFVLVPLFGFVVSVISSHWELAMGLAIAALVGIYSTLNYPEAELGRKVSSMMGDGNDNLVIVDKHPDADDKIRLRSYSPKKANG